MQEFRMPDSYYEQPDNSFTPLQEEAYEAGLWNPDDQAWEDYQAEVNYFEPEDM